MRRPLSTPFFSELEERIIALGGYLNAHLHLDRAGTYHGTVDLLAKEGVQDGTHLSLAQKHAIIPMVHASHMYQVSELESRVTSFLDHMVAIGTSRADTVVDTTTDRVGDSAFEALRRLKATFANRLDFRVGVYSPLGFRDDQPDRWDLLEHAAESADFIGLLPERDDRADYPEHIGFAKSCRRAIQLSERLGKQLHIHVDQINHADERGGETVVDMVRQLGVKSQHDREPMIWVIHLISPSNYEDDRFTRLAENLAELGIGVITCPSAAISMRQLRSVPSPTGNSIARILELLAAGVHVRIGSDNICDITSPMGTPDLMDEIFVLANALRFYDPDVLAHIAAGRRLTPGLQTHIASHLEENKLAVSTALEKLQRRVAQAKSDQSSA